MTLAPDYSYTPEPPPTGDDTIVLHTAVGIVQDEGGDNAWLVAALEKRAEDGKEKYGDYLRINNGRRAVVDYLQEQLDAVMYGTQAYLETLQYDEWVLLEMAIAGAKKAHEMIEKGKK